MNRKQKTVLWAGIAIIALMGIFPPWVYEFGEALGGVKHDAGYKCILTPPERQPKSRDISPIRANIDVPRLCVQWFVIVVINGGLIYTFKGKRMTNLKMSED